MSNLRIIKEFKPADVLVVPEEIKALYPDGDFSFVNPSQPYYVSKMSAGSGMELVKVTDEKIKAKYGAFIEPGTNNYRIGDLLLAVQHKETKKVKDKYIQDLVTRKLPKVSKQKKDKFNESNPLARDGKILTESTIEIERDGKKEKMKI